MLLKIGQKRDPNLSQSVNCLSIPENHYKVSIGHRGSQPQREVQEYCRSGMSTLPRRILPSCSVPLVQETPCVFSSELFIQPVLDHVHCQASSYMHRSGFLPRSSVVDSCELVCPNGKKKPTRCRRLSPRMDYLSLNTV